MQHRNHWGCFLCFLGTNLAPRNSVYLTETPVGSTGVEPSKQSLIGFLWDLLPFLWTFGSGSDWEEDVMMASGKRNADLEEWDAKIRKLTEDFEESDTELEECDTEDEERDRKIRKLTSDLGDVDTKLKERDRKITKLSAEIRRLTALLGDRDSKLRKLTAELAKCDATIRLFTVELGQRHTKIGELTAEVGDYSRKLRKHAAELEERDLKIREHEAEIRRLTELLEDRDSDARERDVLISKWQLGLLRNTVAGDVCTAIAAPVGALCCGNGVASTERGAGWRKMGINGIVWKEKVE
ncbi:uncharacterized protein LOC128075046 isoform X1 [Tympanuchus pallidicinctus]|uniref:uncharacterized protein LOC128075046 isoform X1 n=1 Tax=Tympanuchus pallidicinctus TaxID=109042 RepID=UPI0022873EE6|nr:uncharacterized protein LOC128075046 isoform X1 [Tympanuchus pallidicinctus]